MNSYSSFPQFLSNYRDSRSTQNHSISNLLHFAAAVQCSQMVTAFEQTVSALKPKGSTMELHLKLRTCTWLNSSLSPDLLSPSASSQPFYNPSDMLLECTSLLCVSLGSLKRNIHTHTHKKKPNPNQTKQKPKQKQGKKSHRFRKRGRNETLLGWSFQMTKQKIIV